MAKVGMSLGATLRLTRDNDFQFIRPDLQILDIDTDKNVEEQLAASRNALALVYDEVIDQFNKKVMLQMSGNKELENVVMKQLKEFRKEIEQIKANQLHQ
jgi:hypothetical protein